MAQDTDLNHWCINGTVTRSGLLPNSRGVVGRKRRTLAGFAFVYIIARDGIYEDEQHGRRPVVAPCLITIPARTPHVYFANEADGWQEYFIVFTGTLFEQWQAEGRMDALLPIYPLAPTGHWVNRMSEVTSPTPSGVLQRFEEGVRLQRLVFDLICHAANRERYAQDSWTHRARAAISHHLLDPSPVHAAAHSMGESYESFRKKFRLLTGQAAGSWHAHCLIDRAKWYLEQTDRPIKEIAWELGFADPFHFSKRFRQLAGQSPSHYRQLHREHLQEP